MNITQDCFLAFLHEQGIEEDYIDPHEIGSATYYFEGVILKFSSGCIPYLIAKVYLGKFGLANQIDQIQGEECNCDW